VPIFFDWLQKEPTGTAFWKFLALIVLLNYGFASWVEIVLTVGGVQFPDSEVLENLVRNHTVIFFGLLPFLVAIEEAIFRLPLVVFLKRNASPRTLCVVVAILSILFGLGHGGWIGVPIQGVMGISFCVVFLKCGGLQKKYWKAFLSSTGVHFVHNFIVLGIFLLFLS